MGKRRKTRTHDVKADTSKKVSDGTPKSFVVHSGIVGGSVKALSKDLRRVLEPNTATRLRERKSNKIKDFMAMSGPLGVTHLLVLAQSAANASAAEEEKEEATSNVNLRITRLPRGPTLGFRVLKYALVRDILAATKRPRSPGKEFSTEPILILNNFSAMNNTSDARQLSLLQTMFQNLFPPIKVHSMPLSNARRVVLLSYNPTTRIIDFRHYLINVRPIGISRSVRKIIDGTTGSRKRILREGSVYSVARSESSAPASFAASKAKSLPDLKNAQDISDYILNHEHMGFVSSASEAESDASAGEEEGPESRQIELSGAYIGRGNKRIQDRADRPEASGGDEKRAVRLTELGPRLELGLVKIEDGIGDGKGEVLFHEFIHKTPKEAADIARRAKEREKLAKSRRDLQEKNVKRKQQDKEEKKKEREAKKAKGEKVDEEGGSGSENSESEPDEFEYEDMFAGDKKQPVNDNNIPENTENSFEDEEVFEEEDDDSDLEPIAIPNESSEEEDEEGTQPQNKKRLRSELVSRHLASHKKGRGAISVSRDSARGGRSGAKFNMRAPLKRGKR